MAFTEFTCRSGGSNLYAGSLDGSAEASATPLVTYTNGAWVSGTGVFTPVTGNPVSAGVVIGQWVSVYTDAASAPTGFVGRVTAVSSATITVSLTAKAGTIPTTGVTGITLVVGGAWQGPNGTSGFPFNFAASTMTNAAGNLPRINLKNNATYSVTSGITHSLNFMWFEGYTTIAGDGGLANIDGSTNAIDILTVSGLVVTVGNLILSNNGTTGTGAGLVASGGRNHVFGCVAHDIRGLGFSSTATSGNGATVLEECEAYLCNKSNTADTGGFAASGTASTTFRRCISHDNSGSNSVGFVSAVSANLVEYDRCIADTNGSHGFLCTALTTSVSQCDAYNNGGDGFSNTQVNILIDIENCNAIKNGGYGINMNAANTFGRIRNCGFGSGTAANTSGATNTLATSPQAISGSIIYASGVTPWVDPANGDFRISLAAAKGKGRGVFTQTASSYTGTVGFPDIGAAQHQDAGGTTIVLFSTTQNNFFTDT